MRRLLGLAPLLVAVVLVSHAGAEAPRHVWVLQEPDTIAEIDLGTFAVTRTVKVPHRLLEEPRLLTVNARGQLAFVPPRGAEWGGGELASAAGRAWIWDGRQAREWPLETPPVRGGTTDRPTLTETVRRWFLTARGDALFLLETAFDKVLLPSEGERSVRATARVLRTDLAGGTPRTVASVAAPSCACTTGVCSESCPEWAMWAPDGVVDDFFVLTRFVPGQIGSTYHESRLYRRSGNTWAATVLPRVLERPLAGSARGDALVAAVPDGGCCGWANEGNDQTLLLRGGRSSVLFDELVRYDNRNYDVSFFTSAARFAPGAGAIAYTIVSDELPGVEIRLSSDGKDNAAELRRVRAAIAELPIVEVVLPGVARPTAVIRHAALVGWLSDREFLVAQDGRLVVYDVHGSKRKETPVRVRSAADAFLR